MAINSTQVTIVGNATADPVLKTVGQRSVANVSVAVTERVFDREAGEWRDGDTTFYRTESWGYLGEHVAASVRKGHRVIVHGRLRNREYETDGNRRTSLEIVADEFGPSLTYGTTEFTRTAGGSSAAAPAQTVAPAEQVEEAEAAEEAPKQSKAKPRATTAKAKVAAMDEIVF